LTADKYCKRCRTKTAFASSGLFRVNAQQKHVDIWLIYKCSACDTTWNLTVLSRVNPHSISPETLDGFHENDPTLALYYGSNAPLIKKNGGEPGAPSVEIEGEQVSLEEPVRIHLMAEQVIEVKALAVLRDRLGLSRSEMSRICDSGRLRCVSGQDIAKCKLAGEIVIEIE